MSVIVCGDTVLLVREGLTGTVIRRDSQGNGRASLLVSLDDGSQRRVSGALVKRVDSSSRAVLL